MVKRGKDMVAAAKRYANGEITYSNLMTYVNKRATKRDRIATLRELGYHFDPFFSAMVKVGGHANFKKHYGGTYEPDGGVAHLKSQLDMVDAKSLRYRDNQVLLRLEVLKCDSGLDPCPMCELLEKYMVPAKEITH